MCDPVLLGFIKQDPPVPPKQRTRASDKERKKNYKPMAELTLIQYKVAVYARMLLGFEIVTVHAFAPERVVQIRITECILQSVHAHDCASTEDDFQGLIYHLS